MILISLDGIDDSASLAHREAAGVTEEATPPNEIIEFD